MTTEKKALKMLDVQVADVVMPSILIGEPVEYTCDGVTRTDKVVDKTAFSITVQQPTCKLCIPIEFTTGYQLEKARQDMARPKGSGAAASKRQQMASQPPAEHPMAGAPGHDAAGNLMLPPGSPMSGTQPVYTYMPAPETPEEKAFQHGTLAAIPEQTTPAWAAKPVKEVTIGQVQGDPNWVETAIDEMVGTLGDTLRTLVANAVADAKPEPFEVAKTCFDCVHIDIDGNQCGLFKMLPPLMVISAPEGKCTQFIDGGTDVPM